MGGDWARRVGLAWAGAVALTLGGLVAPSTACGCGAYVPSDGDAAVGGETSLVRFDGSTEQIVMKLQVEGTSSEAAWVLPVPTTAEVSLGDAEVFDTLERLTAPRVEHRTDWTPDLSFFTDLLGVDRGDTAGAPQGGVDVRESARIGPFEVARLAGTDSGAVADWLESNGFALADATAAGLDAYTTDGWEVVAARLAPDGDAALGNGALTPLQVTFETDELLYPMRLSRGADTPQTVRLYLLADHKVEPSTHPTGGESTIAFAGRVTAQQAGDSLSPSLADGTDYLTRWDDTFFTPAEISDDYRFAQAVDDDPYQRVDMVVDDRGWATGLALTVAALLLIVVAVVGLALRSRRR